MNKLILSLLLICLFFVYVGFSSRAAFLYPGGGRRSDKQPLDRSLRLPLCQIKEILCFTVILILFLIKVGILVLSKVRFVPFDVNLNLLRKNASNDSCISLITASKHLIFIHFLIFHPQMIFLMFWDEHFFIEHVFKKNLIFLRVYTRTFLG